MLLEFLQGSSTMDFERLMETEPDTQSRSHSLSWTRNLVSGILRKRDGSDIQSQEVPYTAGKPRNYHARGKPAVSSSRPLNSHTTQQPNAATQSTPPSSQQSPPTATPPTLSAAASTLGIMEAPSRPNVTIRDSGWRTRLMLWVCYSFLALDLLPCSTLDWTHTLLAVHVTRQQHKSITFSQALALVSNQCKTIQPARTSQLGPEVIQSTVPRLRHVTGWKKSSEHIQLEVDLKVTATAIFLGLCPLCNIFHPGFARFMMA
ncbi:uncharacterized protein BJ212DRAFT_1299487 [Suillus subaureus]|uniref:Uncharacterized protein n=1 Tax=Suillus subaureus TaxID=48587 RepID=A0A9P7EBA6_9AGAM|nr:uncharacterized protein BJ212DRAFT_1299487 [Suillus subaureus]KAG1816730.1 hypothetical protein BJ212DRAFT_1299487 [Suillus subaureus]